MKIKIAAIIAASVICMLSATACGKDKDVSSVNIDIKGQTTTASESTTDNNEDDSKTTTALTTKKSSNTTTKTTETTSTAATEEPKTDASEEPTVAPTEAPTEKITEKVTEAPTQNVQQSVSFGYNNLLGNASGVLSSLGTPTYSGGGAACTQGGYDVMIYQYSGLEIQCYVDGGTEYIYSIKITGGSYSTTAGISIGSSRSQVESAYGSGENYGNLFVYFSCNHELSIEYNGDSVSSIEFYTPV